MSPAHTIWSVGHSTHELPVFLSLVHGSGVEVVADIRSQPFSRFTPHFNRAPLRSALLDAKIQYVFLGDELGGRPAEEHLYDGQGHVLYGKLAETTRFNAGLERLISGSERYRVAMMCSEEDPTNCHRRLLVTRVLMERGISVLHIRGGGGFVPEMDLARHQQGETRAVLFGEEAAAWRSVRSVSRSTLRRNSLKA
jgi:uncharacterized protein (DUF488 family)